MTFITKLIIMTQMAMTPNFVWITTDDTESDFFFYFLEKNTTTLKNCV